MQRLLFKRRAAACTTRTYSSAYVEPPRRLIAPVRIVQALQETTGSPLWRWIDVIHARRRVALHESLAANKVSFSEYAKYTRAVKAKDISASISALKERQETVFPAWLLLFAVAYKVKTPLHANGPLVELVRSHLSSIPSEYRPGLLILSAFHLARFNLVAPLRFIVDEFLLAVSSTPTHQSTFYNLFLKSLAGNRVEWGDNAKLVLAVLEAMEARNAKLWPLTYHQLLNDRQVTLELTVYLRDRMIREGVVPNATHFEDYVRIFANNGAIDVGRYKSEVAEFINRDPSDEHAPSAFQFLLHLTKHSPPPPRDLKHTPLGFLPSMPDREWNSAFATLTKANRRHIPSQGVLSLYRKARRERKIESIYSLTTLIRALVARKHLQAAKWHWDRMLKLGFILDTKALTVGLQLFTAFGRPDRAFELLERWAGRVDVPLPAPYSLHKPVALTTVSMNEFMKALHSVRRPDGVFLMWDWMEGLYGMYPDEGTFCVLLRSARMALRMDDTPRGALAQILGTRLFSSKAGRSRKEVVEMIGGVLGGKYKPLGVWKDPVGRAREVFWRAMDGEDGLNVVLTTTSCYEYALLAGLAGLEEELPAVLKAMRARGMEVGKEKGRRKREEEDMLPMVLAFWHDACAANPSKRGRWKGMVDWLVDWLGEEALPTREEIKVWKQNIAIMKEY